MRLYSVDPDMKLTIRGPIGSIGLEQPFVLDPLPSSGEQARGVEIQIGIQRAVHGALLKELEIHVRGVMPRVHQPALRHITCHPHELRARVPVRVIEIRVVFAVEADKYVLELLRH